MGSHDHSHSHDHNSGHGHGHGDPPAVGMRRHRVEWARLLRRVFQYDVTVCPSRGGTMKGIAALTAPDAIGKYLDHVGLPSRAPPISPAQQRHLEFDEAA